MAKKKKKSGGSKKKGSSKKKGELFNTSQLLGCAATAFVLPKLDKIGFYNKLDPKLKAAALILAPGFLMEQGFVKNAIGDPRMRNAIGDSMIYEGTKALMSSFGIAGLAGDRRPKGNEFLAVSIEGLQDGEEIHEDVLSDDMSDDFGEDIHGDGDLSTVNDDMSDDLGDDFGDDVSGDDLSAVNDDFDV